MDAWFAGFADGEAHFSIVPMSRPAGAGYGPRFCLTLRADDLPILETLREEFGGSLRITPTPSGGGRPQADWVVAAKSSLTGLVRYFDQYPLRSKKARDYALWRRAVFGYSRDSYRATELEPLYDALKAGRRFEVSEPATVADYPQLELVREGVSNG